MTVLEVEQAWVLIHETLDQYDPERLMNLRPPAEPSAVTALEQTLGVTLPEDLRISLLTHDGEHWQRRGVLPGAWELSGTQAMADNWTFLNRWYVADREEEQQDTFLDNPKLFSRVRRLVYDPAWLPVTDNSGHHLCVDLAPESKGQSGQVIRWVKALGPERVVAPSFGSYFLNVARKLQRHYAGRASESNDRTRHVQIPPQDSGESA